jgi:RsiW-degrading membrane proteinase PrsW (M82 family)
MPGTFILLVLILISSIPVIVVYIWYRLAKYNLSVVTFLFALLAGAAAFFPALIFQNLITFQTVAAGRLALFLQIFVRIAFTEESSKLLLLLLFFWIHSLIISRSRQADEASNQPLTYGIVKRGAAIGLVAGFGFAILENAVYGASDTGVLLLRAVTAAPLHGACGSRVGAAASMLRTNPIQAIFRLLTATAIHGIYNFMIIIPGFQTAAAILIALSALASSVLTIRSGWVSEENIN